VKEVIDSARKVTARTIAVVETERRAGDAARLVADSSRAQQELRWQPQYPELDAIIAHAWAWEQKVAALARK
jgi:UDP-glucose 4-epimerase